MNAKNLLFKIIVAVGIIGCVFGAYIGQKAFTGNTKFTQDELYVLIPTGADYNKVKEIISPLVKDMDKFQWVADQRSYTNHVKPGRFLLKKGMSSFSLVQSLRRNVPVKVSFNNQERIEDLFVRLADQLEPDTTKLAQTFLSESFLKKYNLTKETALSFFIPDSYEIYWNISAEELEKKFASSYKSFWNEDRLAKAKALNMTPEQVNTLASIVHKETVKADERPRVAGVYLNRLKQNMPLQADPTVIYALKKQSNNWDLVVKRVVNDDTFNPSPYNTYRKTGLPPGPIFMADKSAVDAVLNYEKHNYIFFCASVEKFGYHEFATNYADHQKIAAKYSEWVKKQNYTR
jgi:UPF0755 protein